MGGACRGHVVGGACRHALLACKALIGQYLVMSESGSTPTW